MSGAGNGLFIYLCNLQVSVSAPLAEPSPDTHLAVMERVELSEHRLSSKDLLCLTSLALEALGR